MSWSACLLTRGVETRLWYQNCCWRRRGPRLQRRYLSGLGFCWEKVGWRPCHGWVLQGRIGQVAPCCPEGRAGQGSVMAGGSCEKAAACCAALQVGKCSLPVPWCCATPPCCCTPCCRYDQVHRLGAWYGACLHRQGEKMPAVSLTGAMWGVFQLLQPGASVVPIG